MKKITGKLPGKAIPKSLAGLRPDPANPRRIRDQALSGLSTSLESYGDLSGVVWNVRTGELVAGHQRLRALEKKFGDLPVQNDGKRHWITIPARKDPEGKALPAFDIFFRTVDWDKKTQRAANITANNPHIAGEFTEELDAQIEELLADDADLMKSLRMDKLLSKKKNKGDKGSIEFSAELDFESNYVVLKFSKDIDFTHIQDVLGLKTVQSYRMNGKPWSAGIGRVVDGNKALALIRKKAQDDADAPVKRRGKA